MREHKRSGLIETKRLSKIIRDNGGRIWETMREHKRLIETVRDYQRLLETMGDYERD